MEKNGDMFVACDFLERVWDALVKDDDMFESAYNFIKLITFSTYCLLLHFKSLERSSVGLDLLPRMWDVCLILSNAANFVVFHGTSEESRSYRERWRKVRRVRLFLGCLCEMRCEYPQKHSWRIVDENRVKAVELGAIPFFVNLLFHPNEEISTYALCGLGNLANGGGEYTILLTLNPTEKVRHAFAFSDCFPLLLKYVRTAHVYRQCFILNFFATLSSWREFPTYLPFTNLNRTDSRGNPELNAKLHPIASAWRANWKGYGTSPVFHRVRWCEVLNLRHSRLLQGMAAPQQC